MTEPIAVPPGVLPFPRGWHVFIPVDQDPPKSFRQRYAHDGQIISVARFGIVLKDSVWLDRHIKNRHVIPFGAYVWVEHEEKQMKSGRLAKDVDAIAGRVAELEIHADNHRRRIEALESVAKLIVDEREPSHQPKTCGNCRFFEAGNELSAGLNLGVTGKCTVNVPLPLGVYSIERIPTAWNLKADQCSFWKRKE